MNNELSERGQSMIVVIIIIAIIAIGMYLVISNGKDIFTIAWDMLSRLIHASMKG